MITVSQYESDPRVRRQAEALVARGDEVTVLALHADGRPKLDVLEGVRVVHLPTRKYRGESAKTYLQLYGGFSARALAWLARHPRAFDVVQAHSMPEAVVFAGAVQRLFGVPVLLDVHDITSKLFVSKFGSDSKAVKAVRASEWAAMKFSTEVLTVHEQYAEELRARTSTRVSTVMNCPDLRLFVPRPEFKAWDPAGEVIFSYHGLVAPRHGLIQAVEALGKVRSELPNARMQIRGSGDGLDALRARVEDLGLTEAVDLPTKLYPITEIVTELEKVHIGVVPSQRDPWIDDVLPTKLLEYAVLGVPVITFRNPVIEQYFPDDTVTYVDPASPENLRDAMLAMVRDPEAARAQAARAATLMADLSWDTQREIYLGVIDRLASRRRT